jgi:hypothetical protein
MLFLYLRSRGLLLNARYRRILLLLKFLRDLDGSGECRKGCAGEEIEVIFDIKRIYYGRVS